jgi:glycosyltransferase involved in cell wall biosynthesis
LKILILSATFFPDVAAVSQHLTDLAAAFAARGHRVSVISGRRSYDDPSKVYPAREEHQGVEIRRLAYLGFEKKSRLGRVLNTLSFLIHLSWDLLWRQGEDAVLAVPPPPFVAVVAKIFRVLKKGKFVYWVMDLNPDQAIVAGWLREKSIAAGVFASVTRWTLGGSEAVIVLDRWMKLKVEDKYRVPASKITVLSPWAHDDVIFPVPHSENPFRKFHNLEEKFVVMYSGNHSPCHPLDTVLEAARLSQEDPGVVYCFIGGGSLVEHVRAFKEKYQLSNMIQLPYQPFEKLSESLSAADLHVVSMGDAYVGLSHPSKIYGILAAGRPFVFVGPEESPIGEMVRKDLLGYRVAHGDVRSFLDILQKVRRFSETEKTEICRRSLSLKNDRFNQELLSGRFVTLIENLVQTP